MAIDKSILIEKRMVYPPTKLYNLCWCRHTTSHLWILLPINSCRQMKKNAGVVGSGGGLGVNAQLQVTFNLIESLRDVKNFHFFRLSNILEYKQILLELEQMIRLSIPPLDRICLHPPEIRWWPLLSTDERWLMPIVIARILDCELKIFMWRYHQSASSSISPHDFCWMSARFHCYLYSEQSRH